MAGKFEVARLEADILAAVSFVFALSDRVHIVVWHNWFFLGGRCSCKLLAAADWWVCIGDCIWNASRGCIS